jgi:methionine-S-sulfoxide reductase
MKDNYREKARQNKHTQATKVAILTKLDMATFAMGCFWRPDALFGCVSGVERTQVGYAGGTTANPTYWSLADHIETVQVEYNPAMIDYQQLLRLFFSSHNPTKTPWKRQYMSAVFAHNPEQEEQAEQVTEQLKAQTGQQVYTATYPFLKFYPAEDRHQKYKLQRQPAMLQELQSQYLGFESLVHATAAARINGYLYGFGKKETLLQEISSFGLSAASQQLLLRKANSHQSVSCSG